MTEKRGYWNDGDIEMVGVREYCEEYAVALGVTGDRLVISAWNEAGHNGTEVDLLDVIAWLKANRPDLLS